MNTKAKKETDHVRIKSKNYALSIWKLISSKIEERTANSIAKKTHPAPPRKTSSKVFLKILLTIPYVLLTTFIISFFWDFEDAQTQIFGRVLQFKGLLSILSISGLIGFATNWIAITMLFRPAQKRPLLGHGLVPAQKDRIAYRLARAVSEDLINPDIIKKKIHESKAISKYREQATTYIKGVIDDPEFRSDLKNLTVNYVDEMIAEPEVRAGIAKTILEQLDEALDQNSFEKVALKAYTLLKGQESQEIIEEALIKLPASVEKGLDKLDELLDTLPARIDSNSEIIENIVTNLVYRLINQLDVHNLVEENLREYNEQKLEKLIKNASNDQLKYIQYLGALLGTIGGFVIWEPVISVIVLISAALLFFSLDALIYYLQKTESTN